MHCQPCSGHFLRSKLWVAGSLPDRVASKVDRELYLIGIILVAFGFACLCFLHYISWSRMFERQNRLEEDAAERYGEPQAPTYLDLRSKLNSFLPASSNFTLRSLFVWSKYFLGIGLLTTGGGGSASGSNSRFCSGPMSTE